MKSSGQKDETFRTEGCETRRRSGEGSNCGTGVDDVISQVILDDVLEKLRQEGWMFGQVEVINISKHWTCGILCTSLQVDGGQSD